jgi:preprotein translocase subunit SecG
MYGLLLAFHILVCFALVLVILLQSGKGGGLAGGAFGGTAQTVFGGRGATDFLTRATMVLAGCFFLSSIALAMLTTGRGNVPRSLLQEQAKRSLPAAPQPAPGQAPAQGAPPSQGQPAQGQPPQGQPSQTPQQAPQQNPSAPPSGGGNQTTPKTPGGP